LFGNFRSHNERYLLEAQQPGALTTAKAYQQTFFTKDAFTPAAKGAFAVKELIRLHHLLNIQAYLTDPDTPAAGDTILIFFS